MKRILLTLALSALTAQAARFSFEGVTEPIAQAVVSATVSGKIDEIPVAEGQVVRKGDILVTLERDPEELSVAMTKLVAESKAELAAAKIRMETFRKDYEATKSLFDSSNSVSAETLWEKEMQFKTAEAEHDRLLMMEEKETLESRMAQAELARRVIRAPFNGVVVKLHKRVSESVQALEPLVEVVDVRRCRFVAYVHAPEAQNLQKGQELSLQLDGEKTPRLRTGRIEFISPVVDKSSLLRTVKLVFDNSDGSIEPGVSGRIVRPEAAAKK